MNNGVQAALEFGADALVIVGDSRLAIQQSLGVIACRKDSLITLLNRHRELTAKFKSVRYLHVIREYNAAADSLPSEALESKVSKVMLSANRKLELKELNRIQEMIYDTSADNHRTKDPDALKSVHEHATIATIIRTELQWAPNAEDIDPITVQEERRRRIAVAQDEEQRWSVMKAVLRGDTRKMTYKEEAWKWADKFVLSSDSLLYYVGPSRRKLDEDQAELSLRLVVPTTMIQEVLQNCHDSIEGGHQGVVRSYQKVKLNYYWIGLYADVEKR
ncbi:hypothetical protein PHMEG_00036886 [Phytophthora megakarya]|uniref:Reverse transcriptase n=1 Tax=Phytophthora megakarya TaxID=4795 RepID=A0A225UKY8_9STRA|nr:hypothetical protein PHMEG_00036886 [Phytophthora megakarya]